jgi:catalase (peroxidase I)
MISLLFLNYVGCIDLENPDNAGIEPAIDILTPIVNRYAIDEVSRSDIWALAATIGVDLAQPSGNRIDFDHKWWGRIDCEKKGQTCLDANGSAVTCSAKKGSNQVLPNINMNTHSLYSFFQENFGFNQRDTVTIMGGHAIGVIRPQVMTQLCCHCQKCIIFIRIRSNLSVIII